MHFRYTVCLQCCQKSKHVSPFKMSRALVPIWGLWLEGQPPELSVGNWVLNKRALKDCQRDQRAAHGLPGLSRSRSQTASLGKVAPVGLGSSCFLAIQPASRLGEASSPEAQVCTSVFSAAFSSYYLVNSSIWDTKDNSA